MDLKPNTLILHRKLAGANPSYQRIRKKNENGFGSRTLLLKRSVSFEMQSSNSGRVLNAVSEGQMRT